MGRRKVVAQVLPPDSALYANTTPFRVLERTLKRRNPPPDLAALTLPIGDAGAGAGRSDIAAVDLSPPLAFMPTPAGGAASTTTVHTLPAFPGLYIVKNAIPPSIQRQLVRESLSEYAKPPNLSNLDAHFHLPPQGLWHAYQQSQQSQKQDGASAEEPVMLQRRLIHSSNTPVSSDTEPYSNDDAHGKHGKSDSSSTALLIDPPTDAMRSTEPVAATAAMMRLRWITLGYQYNWTTKSYFLDRRPPFPSLIASMTHAVVAFLAPLTGYAANRWRPEAGIVNLYHPGDSLMAHQDRSEIDMDSPLVSFSVGLDGVLLFGRETRDEMPVGLLLQSGDVLVMAGPARRAFHGVPLVVDGTAPAYLADDAGADGDRWAEYGRFMAHTRLNVNVRQVLPMAAAAAQSVDPSSSCSQ